MQEAARLESREGAEAHGEWLEAFSVRSNAEPQFICLASFHASFKFPACFTPSTQRGHRTHAVARHKSDATT
jgi:hypothetical protein